MLGCTEIQMLVSQDDFENRCLTLQKFIQKLLWNHNYLTSVVYQIKRVYQMGHIKELRDRK